jgi:hypothetical protein
MKRIWVVIGLVSVLMLSACGGETVEEAVPTLASEANIGSESESDTDTTDTTESNTTTSDEETGFTATVSGAVETTVSGSGYFVCSDEMQSLGGPTYLEIQSGLSGSVPSVTMRVRLGIEPGTYELVGWGAMMSPPEDGGIVEFNEGSGGDNWDEGSGELTLTAVPNDNRERIAGSFSAELTSLDAEGTVTVSGEFDFNAASFAFDEGLCTAENRATAEAERAAEQAAAESIELPDVPADLEGMTVTVSDIENGFSAEAVPMFIRSAICTGDEMGWSVQDDVTGEPIINITMQIPSDQEPGTYPVASALQEDRIFFSVIALEADTDEAIQFRAVPQGALRLDAIPTESGDPFTGAFSVTSTTDPMFTDTEASITVEGVFNLSTDDVTLCES